MTCKQVLVSPTSCWFRPDQVFCESSTPTLVRFFLQFEKGDKNPPAADGVTPLHLEITSGDYSICKIILQHVSPAEILKDDLGKMNALQLAIKKAE